MYKIFFNDRIIFLTDKISDNLEKEVDICYPNSCKENLRNLIYEFDKNHDIKKICFQDDNLDNLYAIFRSNFKLLKAAGGLVRNKYGQILAIKRFGMWDLPKGKAEKGEKPRETAVREVSEECGIVNLRIVRALQPTFHTYHHRGRLVLKKTYWYEMKYAGEDQTLIPQLEEEITDALWLEISDVEESMKNTYLSLIDIWKEAYNIRRR